MVLIMGSNWVIKSNLLDDIKNRKAKNRFYLIFYSIIPLAWAGMLVVPLALFSAGMVGVLGAVGIGKEKCGAQLGRGN